MVALGTVDLVDPAMYTKDIVLEEVTLREFEQMERFWRKNIVKPGRERYARILNPLQDLNYERLLSRAIIHSLNVEICVNDHGKWRKSYKRACNQKVLQRFARIAAADERHRNYLEVKLLAEEGLAANWWNKAVIGFVGYQGKIIGYDMVVPPVLQSQFTWRFSSEPAVKVYGLWVPV